MNHLEILNELREVDDLCRDGAYTAAHAVLHNLIRRIE